MVAVELLRALVAAHEHAEAPCVTNTTPDQSRRMTFTLRVPNPAEDRAERPFAATSLKRLSMRTDGSISMEREKIESSYDKNKKAKRNAFKSRVSNLDRYPVLVLHEVLKLPQLRDR